MDHDRRNDLTEPLLNLADLSAQILAHMAHWAAQNEAAGPSVGLAFRKVVGETLRPLTERYPHATVRATRQLLTEAVATIEREIVLVPPPGVPIPKRDA